MAQLLRQQLIGAKQHDDAIRLQNSSGPVLPIPGTGKVLSSAYEQLRNAAEYTEEHLLLQRAIRRFFKRSFSQLKRHKFDKIGEELIVELTHAGYLADSQLSIAAASHISQSAATHITLFDKLKGAQVARDEAEDWTLSLLAVEVEELLNPHSRHNVLASTAYQHYLGLFNRDLFIANEEEAAYYEIALYIAVHQALLKSDISIVRFDLIRMYKQTTDDIAAFVNFNHVVTELFGLTLTARLKRSVSRQGAPFRILKSMADDRIDLPDLLDNQEQFLNAFSQQTTKEYQQVTRRLNKGIIKSIVFIFITKVLIGLGIEIPYDLIVFGTIAIWPLAINLLFPPLYMASLRLGLKAPTKTNAYVLKEYIESMLFSSYQQHVPVIKDQTQKVSFVKKVIYGLLFLIPFAITVWLLSLLHFNIVQLVIFFVFMSTASFLGFRLSAMVRELELITHKNRILSTVRDFFYLPFILVGQWLSSKYAKINAVAYFLDIAIELPLKTSLRLLRQWTRFLNEKHDEIY